jgi:hypothetical protein
MECFVCHAEGGSKVCSNPNCEAVIHTDCLREYRESVHKMGRSAVCACTESFDWQATQTPLMIAWTIKNMLKASFWLLVFEWVVWRTPSLWEVLAKTLIVIRVTSSRFEKLHRLFFDKQTASWLQIACFLMGLLLFTPYLMFHVPTDYLWYNYCFIRLIVVINAIDDYLFLIYNVPEFFRWFARTDYIIIDGVV